MTALIQPKRSKMSRAANGHDCYELPDAKPSFVCVALDALTKECGFILRREPAVGFDEVVAETSVFSNRRPASLRYEGQGTPVFPVARWGGR